MEYKTTAKLVIQACDKDLPGVFGHGCVLLLQGIAREHSLNRAAKSMGMAYSKAWRIVNEAEGQLGCKLQLSHEIFWQKMPRFRDSYFFQTNITE